MLKRLMLEKKLEKTREALKAAKESRAALKKREADLETAVNQAGTDEEIAAADEAVTKLENDVKDHEKRIGNLESDIADIEKEISALEEKEPGTDPKEPTEKKPTEAEGETRMKRIGILGSMRSAERAALMAREDVTEFLQRVRAFKGQERAVTGAELTIPEVVLDLIRDNLHKYSKLITKVRLKPVPGKARQNIMGEIPEAIWTEATGIINELAFGFAQIEVDGYKVAGFIPIPNSILEDSDLNLASEIIEVLAQSIGLAVDKAILYGTGKKMLRGIVARLAQDTEPADWEKNAPAWTDLHISNLIKIDPAGKTPEEFFAELLLALGKAKANYTTGGKWWAMNTQTHAKLLAKTITFNAAGALVAGANNAMPIENGEIIELDFIPDGDIVGGYGSLYLLAERAGASMSQSEHARFIEDQTIFKGTARYDGAPIRGEAFVVINIDNKAPTTSITFAPDVANTVNP